MSGLAKKKKRWTSVGTRLLGAPQTVERRQLAARERLVKVDTVFDAPQAFDHCFGLTLTLTKGRALARGFVALAKVRTLMDVLL